jgi:sulfide:quinone oxidoreductase
MGDFHALICGGGVAGLEGLLRLRTLMGDDIEVTLLAPNDHFVYRPLAVREAVASGWGRRYELSGVADDCGAEWLKDTLASVDTDGRVAHTGDGRELSYDALLIAVGGRMIVDFEHVLTFSDADAGQVYEQVVEDVLDGRAGSVAFILPEGPVYPLPIYELALMTAERARQAAVDGLELLLVTPEPTPLATFGGSAGAVVGRLLTQAGVEVYASAAAHVPARGALLIQPQGVELNLDRMVAMPRIAGPAIRGLARTGAHGFIPIDSHCAVPGSAGRVFAAGDATAFPIKHGGLGAQQADTAAAAIARLAGAGVEVAPFWPEIRGKLLTGRKPVYLRARLAGSHGFDSEVFDTPPWPVDDKVVAQELGPYLAGLDNR